MPEETKRAFLKKVADKTAVVGVIGLGYVGLPLSLVFGEAGFRVLGLDIDPNKAEILNQGRSYIAHVEAARVARLRQAGLFEASCDFSRAAKAEALIICVPTPLNKHREPDLSFVINTMESLLPHLRPGQLVSLESTTYPGTTDEELRPRIEGQGLVIGQDVFLAYSPEREDPANPNFGTKTIPKVLGGATPACLEAGTALYAAVLDRVVQVSSTRVAELTKLLENIYRAVNIGLVNELKIVAERMDIDIHEVIEAASTKPFGFTPFSPGPGLGGHCIPIDPFYLTWKARAYGIHTRFIELAGEVNHQMPGYVVQRVMEGLNLKRGQALKNAKVLILGVAYKKNVDDLRESPALEIIERLWAHGAVVSYTDPFIPAIPPLRRGRFNLSSVELTPQTLAQADCAVLVTNHDGFDYDLILKHAPLLVDTRGVWRGVEGVVRA